MERLKASAGERDLNLILGELVDAHRVAGMCLKGRIGRSSVSQYVACWYPYGHIRYKETIIRHTVAVETSQRRISASSSVRKELRIAVVHM